MNNIALKEYEIDLLYDNIIEVLEAETQLDMAKAGHTLAVTLDTLLTLRQFEQLDISDRLREVLNISKERYCDE